MPPLSSEIKTALIKAAIDAPSADNSQPFQFHWLRENEIAIYIDKSRSGKSSDNRFVLSDIAIGAIIENIDLTAQHYALATQINYLPTESDPYHVANITFSESPNHTSNSTKTGSLINAITKRATDRRIPFKGPLEQNTIEALEKSLDNSESNIMWWHNKTEKQKVVPTIHQAESIRFKSKRLHQELFSTVNFKDETVDEGMHISVLAIEKPAQPFFKLMANWSFMKWINAIGGAYLLGFRSVRVPIAMSPSLALITIKDNSRVSVIEGGRAIQRVWLEATLAGMSIQPFAAPGIFSLGFVDSESEHKEALADIAEQMKAIVKGNTNEFGLMFLRLGYHKKPLQHRTNRRALESFRYQK